MNCIYRAGIIILLLLAGLLNVDRTKVLAGSDLAARETRLSAAKKEGKLLIYASIGKKTGDLLVSEFEKLYPEIRVELIEIAGPEAFTRHMNELSAGRPSADLIWNRNYELQGVLIKDGYALKYNSRTTSEIFPWATIDNSAYATGFEPVAMVYNRKVLTVDDYPATHDALLKAAVDPKLKGKIATCDPELNDTAFRLLTRDQRQGSFWNIVRGFGASGLQLYPDYSRLLDKISSGEALFGFNVPGADAFSRAQTDPAIGYFYPADYTLALLQIVLITKEAPHPNAAMVWIDYILSQKGQAIISGNSSLFPIRGDVEGGAITREQVKLTGDRRLRPILPNSDITSYNEKGMRRGFLLRWKQALKLVK